MRSVVDVKNGEELFSQSGFSLNSPPTTAKPKKQRFAFFQQRVNARKYFFLFIISLHFHSLEKRRLL